MYENDDDIDSFMSNRRPSKGRASTSHAITHPEEIDNELNGPNGQSFRDFFGAVQRAEGGQPDLIVGGQRRFDTKGDHPNIVGLTTAEGPSTAAGNYQITGSNWYGAKGQQGLKHRLGATSFDPENQLRAAMMLYGDRAKRNGVDGFAAIRNGDHDTAIKIAKMDWAALPGSTLHGGRNKRADYDSFLGDAVGGGKDIASFMNNRRQQPAVSDDIDSFMSSRQSGQPIIDPNQLASNGHPMLAPADNRGGQVVAPTNPITQTVQGVVPPTVPPPATQVITQPVQSTTPVQQPPVRQPYDPITAKRNYDKWRIPLDLPDTAATQGLFQQSQQQAAAKQAAVQQQRPQAVPVQQVVQNPQDVQNRLDAQAATLPEQPALAPGTDDDFAAANEYQKSQGKPQMTREQFDAAIARPDGQTSVTSAGVTGMGITDPDTLNRLTQPDRGGTQPITTKTSYENYLAGAKAKGEEPLSVADYNKKADEDALYKGAAWSGNVDLTKKPKGEDVGRYLVRTALENAGHGFTKDEINTQLDAIKADAGTYVTGSTVPDADLPDYIKANGKDHQFTLTNKAVNDILNRRTGGTGIHPDLAANIATYNAQMDKSPEISGGTGADRTSDPLMDEARANVIASPLSGGTDKDIQAEYDRLKRIQLSDEAKQTATTIGEGAKGAEANTPTGSFVSQFITTLGEGAAKLLAGSERLNPASQALNAIMTQVTGKEDHKAEDFDRAAKAIHLVGETAQGDGAYFKYTGMGGRAFGGVPQIAGMTMLAGGNPIIGFGLNSLLTNTDKPLNEQAGELATNVILGGIFHGIGMVGKFAGTQAANKFLTPEVVEALNNPAAEKTFISATLDKARKIQTLAEQGSPGEKEAAQNVLSTFLKKNGLTEADLSPGATAAATPMNPMLKAAMRKAALVKVLAERGTSATLVGGVGFTSAKLRGESTGKAIEEGVTWAALDAVLGILQKKPDSPWSEADIEKVSGSVVKVPDPTNPAGKPRDVLFLNEGKKLIATDITGHAPPEAVDAQVLPKPEHLNKGIQDAVAEERKTQAKNPPKVDIKPDVVTSGVTGYTPDFVPTHTDNMGRPVEIDLNDSGNGVVAKWEDGKKVDLPKIPAEFKPVETPATVDTPIIVSGHEVFKEAANLPNPTEAPATDQLNEAKVKRGNFTRQPVKIADLLAGDEDLQQFVDSHEDIKPGRKIKNPIVLGAVTRGGPERMGVVDGMRRTAQAIANGDETIEAYVPTAKDAKPFNGRGIQLTPRGTAIAESAPSSEVEKPAASVDSLDLPDDLAESLKHRIQKAEEFGHPAKPIDALLRDVIATHLAGFRRNNIAEALRPFIEQVRDTEFDVLKDGGKLWEAAHKAIEADDAANESGDPKNLSAKPASVDVAAQRRKDGEYTEDGVQYKRQDPIRVMGEDGKSGKIKFAEGEPETGFKYVVVDDSRIQPSHVNGQPNRLHFLPEAQPNKRTDDVSIKTAQKIGANYDPNLDAESSNPFFGPMVVNNRGEVIQGNNRAAGAKLRTSETVEKNKAWLVANAKRFGIDPKQVATFKRPVLARMVDVSDDEAIRLGQFRGTDLETGHKGKFEPDTIAARMSPEDRSSLLDTLFHNAPEDSTLTENIRERQDKVYKHLAKHLTEVQMQALTGTDKRFTPDAVDEIKKTVRQFLLRGASTELPELFQSLPSTARRGLDAALPHIFGTPKEASIVPDVQHAIMAATAYLHSDGQDFGTWSKQADMFKKGQAPIDVYTPTELALAKMLTDAKRIATVKNTFKAYADAVNGTKGDMFSGPSSGVDKAAAVKSVLGVNHEERAIDTSTENATDTGTESGARKSGSLDDETPSAPVETKPTESVAETPIPTFQEQKNQGRGTQEKPIIVGEDRGIDINGKNLVVTAVNPGGVSANDVYGSKVSVSNPVLYEHGYTTNRDGSPIIKAETAAVKHPDIPHDAEVDENSEPGGIETTDADSPDLASKDPIPAEFTHNGLTVAVDPIPFKDARRLAIQDATVRDTLANLQKYIDRYIAEVKDGAKDINSDNAKTLYKDYNDDPLANVSAVHEASSLVAQFVLHQQARNLPKGSTVLLTGGGAASGKTRAAQRFIDASDLIYDSVMKNEAKNRALIDSMLAYGHHVDLAYVFADLAQAAKAGVKRWVSKKRIVPIHTFADGHVKSAQALINSTYQYAVDNGVDVTIFNNVWGVDPTPQISLAELKELAYSDIGAAEDLVRDTSYAEYQSKPELYTDDRIPAALEGQTIESRSGYGLTPNDTAKGEPDSGDAGKHSGIQQGNAGNGPRQELTKPSAPVNYDDLLNSEFANAFDARDAKKAKESTPGFDDLRDIFGFEPPQKSALEVEKPFYQSVYKKAQPAFEKAMASFDGTDPREQVKTLVAKLQEEFTLEQLVEMKPYLLRYLQDNSLQSATDGSKTELDAETGDNAGDQEAGLGEPSAAGNNDVAGDLGSGQSDAIEATGSDKPITTSDEETGVKSGSGPRPKSRNDKPASTDIRDTPDGGTAIKSTPTNFHVSNELDFSSFSPKTRYKNNVEALKVLQTLDAENRPATPEEQSVLAGYVGWGGMPQVFDENHKDWTAEHKELKELLPTQEYDKARRSIQDAHFTSKTVVDGIWNAAKQFGFQNGAVLEPSMGTGNFFGLMPKEMRNQLTGVEFDPLTGKIAQHLYPKADIHIRGFQETYIAPNSQDLVVGNPPFGAQKLHDPNSKELSKLKIHAYFIAKGIDSLRPGGILSVVVSKGFMDANDPQAREAREYVSKRANLIGAIRLPNTAFKTNANTEVTTDLVFFQKKGPGVAESTEQWNDIGNLQDEKTGDPIPVNRYFANHPEMMLGKMTLAGSMYRANEPTLEAIKGSDLSADIAKALTNLPSNILTDRTAPIVDRIEAGERRSMADYPNMIPYNFGIRSDGTFYQLHVDQNGRTTEEPIAHAVGMAAERIKKMIAIRDLTTEYLAAQAKEETTDEDLKPIREKLNAQYDAFVKKHGYMGQEANKRAFREDPQYPLLQALEDKFDKGVSAAIAKREGIEPRNPSAKKSDILTQRTNYPVHEITSADNAQDALMASLVNKGGVDLDYMSGLYNGKTPEEITTELGPMVYEDPKDNRWTLKDEYLSGDVKTKLAEAEKAVETDKRFSRNVLELQKVQPKDKTADEIFTKLGSNWIPFDVFQDFYRDLTGGSLEGMHSDILGRYTGLRASTHDRTLDRNRWGTDRAPSSDIIKAILSNRDPVVKDPVLGTNPTKYVVNQADTAAAVGKAEEMRDEFQQWIWKDNDRRKKLVDLFNEKFNRIAKRTYDGSHLIDAETGIAKLPGLSRTLNLRPHILNAVFRIIQDGKALIDHTVGAGKTPLAITAGMEMRRLGLSKKPVYVVPNHLVEQWGAEFKKFYPGARVLAASRKDFGKDRRTQMFAKIATGDWDAVIVAHSSFAKVKVPPDVEQKFMQEQIDEIVQAIKEQEKAEIAAGTRRKSRSLKDLEKLKDKLVGKLAALRDAPRDSLIDFGGMGIDSIFVDECFPYDTPILTDRGWLPIGEVVENKLNVKVLSFNSYSNELEWKKAIRWIPVTRKKTLCRITHQDGHFTCTTDHKIWTNKGYVEAAKLTKELSLQLLREDVLENQPNPIHLHTLPNDNKGLRAMRSGVQFSLSGQGEQSEATVLWDRVRGDMAERSVRSQRGLQQTDGRRSWSLQERTARPSSVREDETKQSNEQPRYPRENAQIVTGADVFGSRRQFGTDQASTFIGRSIGFPNGISDSNGIGQTPIRESAELLQSRFGGPDNQARYRSGREHTQTQEVAVFRQEENRSLRSSRVVSVEILESGSADGNGQGYSDYQTVYDIEVEDNHNFFAAGILVSNCHKYKNLYFTTQKQGVSGLGDTKGSQRAFDMFMKTQMVLQKNNDRNVVFLTGTPVSNSLSEIYHMQRYLQNDVLKSRGLQTFDAWANAFSNDVKDWQLDAAGRFTQRTRFSKFANLPALRQLWQSITDSVSLQDLKDAAVARGDKFPVPKVKFISVIADRSPEQAAYIGLPHPETTPDGYPVIDTMTGQQKVTYAPGTIIHRLENWQDIQRNSDPKENVLRITTNARQAGLDMRLIDANTPDFPGSKLNKLADNIAAEYKANDYRQGTQLMFLDVTAPKGKSNAPLAPPPPPMSEDLDRQEIKDDDADDVQSINPDDFYASKSNFDAYAELRNKLVERGIPEKQIAFIHDYNTDDQKASLFGKVNRGDIRVLFGSTSKMGEGMNVQKKLVAIHNGDAPWNPAALEQRNGRGIRQGNEFYAADPDNFEMHIHNYATDKTYDARMWELNEQKGTSNDRFRYAGDDVNEIEDISAESANAAEMKAAATGDARILKSVKLLADIRKLDQQAQAHKRGKFDLEDKIKQFDAGTTPAQRQLERSQMALKIAEANPKTADTMIRFGDKEWKASDFKLSEADAKLKGDDLKAAQAKVDAVKAAARTALGERFEREAMMRSESGLYLGKYRGFKLNVAVSGGGFNRYGLGYDMEITLTDPASDARIVKTVFHDAAKEADVRNSISLSGVMTRLDNMVDGIKDDVAHNKAILDQKTKEVESAREEVDKPFVNQAELDAKKAESSELLKALRSGGDVDFKADEGNQLTTSLGSRAVDGVAKIEFQKTAFKRESDGDPVFLFRVWPSEHTSYLTSGPTSKFGLDESGESFLKSSESGILVNRDYDADSPDTQRRSLDDANTPEEQMTVDEMKALAHADFDDLLDGRAKTEVINGNIKANAASHEIYRRALEMVRIKKRQAPLGSDKFEDLFTGVFLKPDVVKDIQTGLAEKRDEATQLGYTPAEVQVFQDHIDALAESAKDGKGTATIYVLDKALPHEMFHRADYMGATSKALMERHTPASARELDAHPVTAAVEVHFAKFNTYREQKGAMRAALIRSEIPPLLLESSDKQLADLGITPGMRADYLFRWFEGYAAKNGIDSLDNFRKGELDVQDFISQVNQAFASTQTAPAVPRSRSDGSPSQENEGDTVRHVDKTRSETRTDAEGDRGTERLNANEKMRSLPATMRAAGLDAIDEAYEVFHDRDATDKAAAILNERGIEGSIQLLRDLPADAQDAQHAILSFMMIRALQDHANSIHATDPETAEKNYALSLELAREHAIKATQAGRFTRIPSVIGPTLEHLLYTVQGAIEAKYPGKGHVLSPEDREKWEGLGRHLEDAFAKNLGLQKEVRNQKAVIKRLQEAKAGKKRLRSSAGQKNRARLVELVKNEKQKSVDTLRAKLKAQFGGTLLETTAPFEPAQKSAITPDSDVSDVSDGGLHNDSDFPIDDFANVGAMMLTEGIAGDGDYLPHIFEAEMVAEYGDAIKPYFDEIYQKSWERRNEWLNEIRQQQTKERIENKYNEGEDLEDWQVEELLGEEKAKASRRRAIENYHRLASKGKAPNRSLDDMKRIISDLSTDPDAAVGAVMHAEGLSANEMYRRMNDVGITDQAKQRDTLRKGKELYDKAKLELTDEKNAIANEILEAGKELKRIDLLKYEARNELNKVRRTTDRELRRITSGEFKYRLKQAYQVKEVSRTLMAAGDMSGAIRQGGFLTAAKPEVMGKAFADMFKSLREKGYAQTMIDIENQPLFSTMQRAGVDFAVAGKGEHADTGGEEVFRGDDIIQQIPLVGYLIHNGITKWSEQTYTGFLDSQRAIMADLMFKDIMAQGKTFQADRAEFEKIAKFINVASGRGTLPTARLARLLLELPLFAPRYTLSRFQLLNMTLNPVAYYHLPASARRIVAQSAGRTYGTMAAVLAIAAAFGLVSFDPYSPDFLKIRVGNSRWDVLFGTQQVIRLMLKLVSTAIRTDVGMDNRLPGEAWNEAGTDLLRFGRGKLSPWASLLVDAGLGSDFVGNQFDVKNPTHWATNIGERLIPLTISDVASTVKADGWGQVPINLPLAFFGVGVSAYKNNAERPVTEAEKLAAKAAVWDMKGGKTDKAARDLKNDLVARSRKGEDVSADIADGEAKGLLSPNAKKDILAAASKTYLIDKAEGLKLEYFIEVMKAASPSEREALMELANKKMKNAEVNKTLTPAMSAELSKLGAHILGYIPMPDDVQREFDRHGIKTPDVKDSVVVTRKGPNVKLGGDRYEKYRSEMLQKVYDKAEEIVSSQAYKNATDEKQKEMLKKAEGRQKTIERNQVKQSMLSK